MGTQSRPWLRSVGPALRDCTMALPSDNPELVKKIRDQAPSHLSEAEKQHFIARFSDAAGQLTYASQPLEALRQKLSQPPPLPPISDTIEEAVSRALASQSSESETTWITLEQASRSG